MDDFFQVKLFKLEKEDFPINWTSMQMQKIWWNWPKKWISINTTSGLSSAQNLLLKKINVLLKTYETEVKTSLKLLKNKVVLDNQNLISKDPNPTELKKKIMLIIRALGQVSARCRKIKQNIWLAAHLSLILQLQNIESILRGKKKFGLVTDVN